MNQKEVMETIKRASEIPSPEEAVEEMVMARFNWIRLDPKGRERILRKLRWMKIWDLGFKAGYRCASRFQRLQIGKELYS